MRIFKGTQVFEIMNEETNSTTEINKNVCLYMCLNICGNFGPVRKISRDNREITGVTNRLGPLRYV